MSSSQFIARAPEENGLVSGDAAQSQAQNQAAAKASKKSAAAFRTISEVAVELDVQQHVLRFWESKFSQIRPLKRGGGRRYYRPEDIDLLRRIHHLLYTEGYTIKGVQKLLREQGKKAFVEGAPVAVSPASVQPAQPQASNSPGVPPVAVAKAAASVPMAAQPAVQVVEKRGLSMEQREALKDMLAELKDLRRIVTGE